MTKKIDEEMMQMGEDVFWDEFNAKEEDRQYVVIDSSNKEVVVSGARFTKKKKKIRV